jgi:hypothetical protein
MRLVNECNRLLTTVTVVRGRFDKGVFEFLKGASGVPETCLGVQIAGVIFPASKHSVRSASTRGMPNCAKLAKNPSHWASEYSPLC